MIQWTKGCTPGASGSSAIMATDFVPAGRFSHAIGGEMFCFVAYFSGMTEPWRNAGDVMRMVIAMFCGRILASFFSPGRQATADSARKVMAISTKDRDPARDDFK